MQIRVTSAPLCNRKTPPFQVTSADRRVFAPILVPPAWQPSCVVTGKKQGSLTDVRIRHKRTCEAVDQVSGI